MSIYAEMGIGQIVREFYEITRNDLDLIALLIAEEQELEREMREVDRRAEDIDHG